MAIIKTKDDVEVIPKENLALYESPDDSFKKANAFIESKYKATLTELKILDILIWRIQHKKYITIDENDGSIVCSIPAKELKKLLGVKSGSFYSQLKPIAASMAATTMGYEDDEKQVFAYLPLFTLVKYEDAIFQAKINNDLKQYINPSTKFTILQVPSISKYKSRYTLKLHQLLLSYCFSKKRVGSARFAPKASDGRHFKIEMGINELKFTLGVVDSSAKQVKKILAGNSIPDYDKAMRASNDKSYDNWSDFRKRVIDVAVKEINKTSEYGMNVSYEAVKAGKGAKVYSIIFYVEMTGNRTNVPVEGNKQEKPKLSEDEMFDIHFMVKSMIKEDVKLRDIKTICEAADYDMEKIKNAYEIACTSGHIDNLVGFLIKAIKENYDLPVKKESAKKQNKFNNFHQRDYDFDEYEKALLNRRQD